MILKDVLVTIQKTIQSLHITLLHSDFIVWTMYKRRLYFLNQFVHLIIFLFMSKKKYSGHSYRHAMINIPLRMGSTWLTMP